MAVYQYNALDVDNTPVDGIVTADTSRQARDQLRERGLTITAIEQASTKAGALAGGLGGKRRSEAQVRAFVRELSTLLRSGIVLLPALNTLSDQHGRKFSTVIKHLADQIAAGSSLADAMNVMPQYFDSLCVSIVRVGENTGSLDTALKRLAEFKEKSHRLRSRVSTAMVYPAFVMVIGLAVTIFLMTYVVPNLLKTLKQAGRDLPAITWFISSISDALLEWWWLILLCAAALAMAFRAILRTELGHLLADKLWLRLPLVGDMVRKENTSRLAVVIAALLRSGLQFVQAVEIARNTIRNRVFRRALQTYQDAVTAGKDIAGPLKQSGVFSPMVVQMLSVGQQTGNLEEMLEQLAEGYDQEVAIATARFTAILEPLLIVCLAVMVGFIAFATILPILEISNAF